MANPFSNIAQIMGNRGVQQGASAPTDPRQQTMMQQLGITNPLLQQFGQQVGNLAGVDTRSADQQVASAASKIDARDPDYLIKLANSIKNIDPIKAAELIKKHEDMKTADKYTYGSSVLMKGTDGKLYQSTQRRSSTGGFESVIVRVDDNRVINDATGLGLQPVPTTTGMTAQEQLNLNLQETRALAQQESAQKEAENMYGQISSLRQNTGTLAQLVDSIDDGATVSLWESWVPTVKGSTARKESLINRLGLEVVSGTTFGALSEGELKLALQVAVPNFTNPADMRKWAKDRMSANKKLEQELTLAVNYLEGYNEDGTPRTRADLRKWLEERSKSKAAATGQDASQIVTPTVSPQADSNSSLAPAPAVPQPKETLSVGIFQVEVQE